MNNTILLAGGTGLIGQNLLQKLEAEKQIEMTSSLVRRKMSTMDGFKKLKQIVVDFEALKVYESELKGSVFICTLGTTIKKAKTKENFYKVDHDYPLELAKLALKNGARHLILVSAVGADARSSIFYNQTKGKLEDDLKELEYESIHIIRPSLLLGDREEKRRGEKFFQSISKSISFLFPMKYKPIDINIISKKIIRIIENPKKGFNIYEGKDIYV